jgi:hypothetical protein
MRRWSLTVPGFFSHLPPVVMLTAFLLTGHVSLADDSTEPIQVVPSGDYAIYDRIVQAKFLTSDTTLVFIRRLTATHIGPEQVPFRRRFFDENQFFDAALPPTLLTNFLAATLRPSRLESKFQFGVRYRLVSDFNDGIEEARGAVRPVTLATEVAEPRIRLELSRVAYTPTRDLALVYVGDYRSDGTGAGFLVLLHAEPSGWEIQDTEVVWTMR